MPAGTSIVTPTSPASSVASDRVKPTTPNLLAQYAVASPKTRSPSVEATVTMRPPLARSDGRAAWTTAAVPRRFTATVRSQSSHAVSASGAGASTPAAVTTPRTSPCSWITRATAARASAGEARSTTSRSTPLSGSRRSRTTGVPPAPATAAATAAPRPDAPPVTMTVPRSDRTGGGLLEQSGAGAALEERQQLDAPAPSGDHLGLRQVGDLVVAALRPDVGSQALEQPDGRVLVEDHDLVDAAQRAQDRGAVLLRDERSSLALRRRTESSEFRHTTSRSPSARAASSVRT